MRRTLGLPIALVAAIVVAEGAVLLFRPRDLGPAPVPVEARAYFSPAQLDRAEDFRSGQLWLYGARLLIEGGVLVLLVRRAPARLLQAGRRRPVLAGAGAAAAISVVLGLAPLPVSAIARERAKDVGLVTQDWIGWVGDIAKSQAIGAVIAGVGGALLIVGMRRLGRQWWVGGAVVVVMFGIATTYLSPIVLDPLFNTFTPLKEGRTRSDVLELAKRAGVDVGQVYEIDASRRTSGANAYVAGLGHTKRVVLYDNLLRDFTPAEVRLVVAHELGHVRHRDVPHGLLYLAIVAPFGMFAVARLGERLAGRDALGTPAALPGVVLAVALVAPTITVISNQLSRAVERRADAYALELTNEPRTQIAFQRRIVIKNVSDPDPPAWVSFLLGTHPPAIERIGQAEAAARASPRDG
ncbi:MAG TPA: M48 family metallopeptidase [Solirubrobacteraceae bacterium]|nr:M48 family metallopeptidase [Solirubrobacteraceae bacterium]